MCVFDCPSPTLSSTGVIVLLFPECMCNPAGVHPAMCPGGNAACLCDPATGTCPCLPNVVGTTCDQCASGYWDLASGKGCQICDCDERNSLSNQCNQARKILCFREVRWCCFGMALGGLSYEDSFLLCSLKTSLWKFAVGAVTLGHYTRCLVLTMSLCL